MQRTAKGTMTGAPPGTARGAMDYLGLLLRGYAMGAADVVPGVSGGTMAFILGIYEELIESIRRVASPAFIRALLAREWRDAFAQINLGFLVAVASGILLAIVTLAEILDNLLRTQPELLRAFFFGLVLASVFVVARRVERWDARLLLSAVVAAVAAFLIVGIVPVTTPDSWWFLILSGALAICAMILPGISGAFILLLLGKYQTVLGAVVERDLVTVGLVGVGAVVGIVTIAQVLGWLFKHYHDLVVAFLTGLMLGSLRKIWPWKEVVSSFVDRHGETIPLVERNILPASFGQEALIAIALFIVGFIAVLMLERLGAARPTAHATGD